MTRGLEAIVFDFDGVIADSERLHLLAYQEVLAPLGLQLTEAFYKAQLLGYTDQGVFEHYARAHRVAWDEATVARLIDDKTRLYEELAGRGEMLYPGAAEFIRQAAARVPVGVASGALTQEIEDILDRARIRPLFSAIVGADQTVRSKPSPDPYREAFARVQQASRRALDPQRTVAIEDSKWGLWSAKGAGLRLVAVTNTYPAAEFAGIAELVVAGLHDLTLDALDELCATIVA
jgi:HAD superfamily hydrolase (TIGR01509 family)